MLRKCSFEPRRTVGAAHGSSLYEKLTTHIETSGREQCPRARVDRMLVWSPQARLLWVVFVYAR
jgi:hypothetical protein